jgi:hypothetical protein
MNSGARSGWISGLVDEVLDHPVELQAVIGPLSGQELDSLHRLGREVRAHLDDDAALGGVDHQGLGGVQGPPIGGVGGGGEGQGGERSGEGADHGRDYRREASLGASQAY